MNDYRIIRFYAPHLNKRPRATGVKYDTLEEAQAHCKRADTHGEDWFDGYTDK